MERGLRITFACAKMMSAYDTGVFKHLGRFWIALRSLRPVVVLHLGFGAAGGRPRGEPGLPPMVGPCARCAIALSRLRKSRWFERSSEVSFCYGVYALLGAGVFAVWRQDLGPLALAGPGDGWAMGADLRQLQA